MPALLLALALCLVVSRPGAAGTLRDRVVRANSVHCGTTPRPGFAEATADADRGGIAGLAVDLCRAVAVAVLGPAGRVEFRLYETGRDFDPVRDGDDEIAFLDGPVIGEQALADRLIPGPPVMDEGTSVMVPDASAARGLADLAGTTVCLMIGGAGQSALEAALERARMSVARLGFQEDVEMLDAYNVGRCVAVVADDSYLVAMRRRPGIRDLRSRVLSPPLARRAVIATTPAADGAWASLVFWTLTALREADAPASRWRAANAAGLGLRADRLGLRPGWQEEVAATVGSFAAMRARWLGAAVDDSPVVSLLP